MLDEVTVRLLVGRGCTHKKISDYYQTLYPNTRGYSEKSIRRFCRAYNIRRISKWKLTAMLRISSHYTVMDMVDQ